MKDDILAVTGLHCLRQTGLRHMEKQIHETLQFTLEVYKISWIFKEKCDILKQNFELDHSSFVLRKANRKGGR